MLDGKIPPVVDNLTSTSATAALSANQGRVINDALNGMRLLRYQVPANGVFQFELDVHGYVLLSTQTSLHMGRSLHVIFPGNLMNTGQVATVHTIVPGAGIAITREVTPSTQNRMTVTNTTNINGGYIPVELHMLVIGNPYLTIV